MKETVSLTIGIPNYSRPSDLDDLLNSLSKSTVSPDEILICDDHSPEEEEIHEVIRKWMSFFGSKLIFLRNQTNIGYDRNLKKIISSSSSTHVVFIGNDDIILPNSLSFLYEYIKKNNHLNAFSRTFYKFKNNTENITGISRSFQKDCTLSPSNSSPSIFLRLSAYFSGLIVNREWALSKSTDCYDSSLYYQVFLFGCAFYEGGIGYLDYPIIGGRTNGMPLFGSHQNDKSIHEPGGFSAEARIHMWNEILRISSDLEKQYQSPLIPDIKNELGNRLCFHVFEKFSQKSRKENLRFIQLLIKNKIFFFRNTIFLSLINITFGVQSIYFYRIIRSVFQKI